MNLTIPGTWVLAALSGVLVLPFTGVADGPEEIPIYATVFLVRGSVVGSHVGEFGPFVRRPGTDWQRISLSHVICYSIAFAGNRDGQELYLAAGNGLHHTSDGGRSWRILTGWTTREVMTVLTDPVHPEVLVIGTAGGVFRSHDAGKSWHEISRGLGSRYVKVLGPDPRSSTTLFALADDDLYRTTNGGEYWTPLGLHGTVVSFWQNPQAPDDIIAGVEDGGLRRSTDNGRSWDNVRGLDSATVYAIAGREGDSILYAGGWATGMWKSSNRGLSWESLGNIPGVNCIFCIAPHPEDPSRVFAGTDGQGVFESPDGGRSWRFAGLAGGKVKQVIFLPSDKGRHRGGM